MKPHPALALLAAAFCTPVGLVSAQLQVLDASRFEVNVLAVGMDRPMELTVAPDGRVLWIELTGKLRIYQPNSGAVIEAASIDVFAEQENGLLGLALDPNFVENQHLYLLYSPTEFSGQRLSRFSLNGNTLDMESEQEILTFEEQRRECCHHAGALEFGPNGLLFIATGDNTHPGGDAQGFAPIDEREDRYPFDAQKGPSNTQSLSGKILRIRLTDNGYEIPTGNLFENPNDGRPEIYVMGCRNPWRIGVDQKTGFVYWGEVGPDAGADGERGPRGYDEINQARKAGNFGWPYFIADNQAYRDVDFASNEIGAAFDVAKPINRSPNNTGAEILPAATPAWIFYPYGDSDKFPELNAPGGRTACAGPVYDFDAKLASGSKFPPHYDRCLFAFEWSRNWITAVHLDDNSQILRLERFLPDRRFKRPVDMEFGPDGSLYVLEYGSTWGTNDDSALLRIDYQAGNRAPKAQIQLANNISPAPLLIQPTASGTFDPDGDDLSYSWRMPPAEEVLSTSPNPQITVDSEGVHNLELRVTDPSGLSATSTIPVLVGNTPPQVRFEFPKDGGFLAAAKGAQWGLHVFDAEDGDASQFSASMLQKVSVEVTTYASSMPSDRASQAESSSPGRNAIAQSDCFNCHAMNRRVVGPSFMDVAARYRGENTALDDLASKVRLGSTGTWGAVPMLPHPQHSLAQTRQMVAWILELNQTAPMFEIQRGLSGFLAPLECGNGYVLTATYADAGGKVLGSLNGQARLRLRHPAVEAENFSSRSGTSTLSSETATNGKFIGAINAGNHLRFEAVNLAGIATISLRVSSAGAGGAIELRSQNNAGELLASTPIVPNGAWEEWYEIELAIQASDELIDLFVVFQNPNGGGGLMNLDRLYFLRAGEKIGDFTE
ncbi:MAG: PQQ-dependent sugar dehydrogenase [Planctomycetes bacterium]|nr:PQQ-dependent sugar dehydrogenase [Planctomycetota bacterium]